ncbi:MAG TPA: excinuclease ABC subunit C [Bacteroidetes bacterium]|nr:excinuclease ABC subunit C [Bacteroidota bacterium]
MTSKAHPENVKDQLALVPDDPGIYKYYDKKGKLLYIGKAKNLKKRVRSYFVGGRGHSYRIATMVEQIADIRYTITLNEVEALTLENALIKEHQPKYNINLKDGKTYPYICIKKERFPRIFPTRTRYKDGSEYFGPFTSVKTMNAFLNLIRQNYKFRTCNYKLSEANVEAGKFKLCLEYQIKNCFGPCEARYSEEAYNLNIDAVRKILKGSTKELLKQLEGEMQQAAAGYAFEKAEEIRQRIEEIRVYRRRNTIVSETITDVEVLTVDRLNDLAIINHFKVVNGTIIATHSWEVRIRNEETDAELLSSVFVTLQASTQDIGQEILCNVLFEPEPSREEYKIRIPGRGDKKMLVDLSLKNCRVLLEEKVWKQNLRKRDPQKSILEQLQKDLRLPTLPQHIECFDNSNIQGQHPVASMVVFKDGRAAKKDYRHFKIKTVVGANDFASMEEIVLRRYRRLMDEEQALPDLVIVDGGKGQLSSAAQALTALGLLGKLPIFGIAKRLEEIYAVNDSFPLHLDKRSTSLKLIQQLRDEAHRFAITFHRDLRSKGTFQTRLTTLEGIGPGSAKKLLSHFRSVKKIRAATEADLASVVGQNRAKILRTAIDDGSI